MNNEPAISFDNRCRTCLMPDHAVTINTDGCEYCRPEKSRDAVDVGRDLIPNDNQGMTVGDIVTLASSSGGKYNCLVGLSGGRDSTFLLYYVKKVLKLEPLAANFRTRFQTEQAKRNIADAASRMDVDLVTYTIDDAFFQKLVKGFFVTYGEFCSPCHKGHHYTLYKFAEAHGIKLIIRGISSKIDLNKMDPEHFDFFCKSEAAFNERVGTIAQGVGISEEERKKHQPLLHLEATRDRRILTIDLPDLLDWSYQRIQSVLDAEFNWIHPPNQFFHCDCKMNPLLCYKEYKKHGYSEKQIIISNHLSSNDFSIERGRALLLSEEVPDRPRNLDETLALIDVDRDTFEATVDTFWRADKRGIS